MDEDSYGWDAIEVYSKMCYYREGRGGEKDYTGELILPRRAVWRVEIRIGVRTNHRDDELIAEGALTEV